MERRGRASWGVVTISQVLFKGVGCQPLQVDGAQWCGARRGLGQWLLETRSQQVWGSSWESSSCKYVAQTCLTRASPPALDRTPGGVPEGQTPLPGPQGLTDLPPGLSLPDAGDVAHWGSEWAQGQQGQRGYLGTSPLREETGADEEEVGCPGQRHVCRGGTFFPHLEGPGRGPQSRGLQGRG